MKSLSENIQLSILEIFSILFSGAAMLLLCLQVRAIQAEIQHFLRGNNSEWKESIWFLGTAYFLGYVLFYIPSFLDMPVYDRLKGERKGLVDKVIGYRKIGRGRSTSNKNNKNNGKIPFKRARLPRFVEALQRGYRQNQG